MREGEPKKQNPTTRFLLWSGAVGPLLFAIVFLIEGATRSGYDAWRTTISTLSLSDYGWMQIANFHLFGLMTLCFSVGLKRTLKRGTASSLGPILFAVLGIGLILAGIFVTDPCLGYPIASPAIPPESLHGMIHNIAALIVFLALPVICFVMGRRFARYPGWRSWATLSMVTGGLVLFFFAWFFTSVSASADAVPEEAVHAGLLERITSIIGCLWMSALALRLLRRPVGAGARRLMLSASALSIRLPGMSARFRYANPLRRQVFFPAGIPGTRRIRRMRRPGKNVLA